MQSFCRKSLITKWAQEVLSHVNRSAMLKSKPQIVGKKSKYITTFLLFSVLLISVLDWAFRITIKHLLLPICT